MEDLLYSIGQKSGIYSFMHTSWGWPTVESLHFLGLSLLIGCIGLWDLRLLGVARGIPMDALHRLVPWGVGGYALADCARDYQLAMVDRFVSVGSTFAAVAPDRPGGQAAVKYLNECGLATFLRMVEAVGIR